MFMLFLEKLKKLIIAVKDFDTSTITTSPSMCLMIIFLIHNCYAHFPKLLFHKIQN